MAGNGFPSLFGTAASLLIETVSGSIASRFKALKIDTANLTLTDNADGTATLGATGGGGAGGTLDVLVANTTGSTILKNSVVNWQDGVDASGNPTVAPSSASDRAGFGNPFGVLLADIPNNGTGQCRVIGNVTAIDTHLWTPGTDLYAGNSGGFQTFSSSLTSGWVGVVLVQNATAGVVFVGNAVIAATVAGHGHGGFADGGVLATPLIQEVASTLPSPAAGNQYVFIDVADHKLKRKDSSATVTTIEGGGGTTDVLMVQVFS